MRIHPDSQPFVSGSGSRHIGVWVTAALVIPSLLCGCGTPMAVKKLSAEQVAVQQSYELTLKSYFQVIEAFADAQEKAVHARIDLLTREKQAILQRNAIDEVSETSADPAKKHKAIHDLSDGVNSSSQLAQTQKAKISDLIQKLKDKDKEILAAHKAILDAQLKLDEYIQMKKSDEAGFEQLTAIVGINREKLNGAVGEVALLSQEIQTAYGSLMGATTK